MDQTHHRYSSSRSEYGSRVQGFGTGRWMMGGRTIRQLPAFLEVLGRRIRFRGVLGIERSPEFALWQKGVLEIVYLHNFLYYFGSITMESPPLLQYAREKENSILLAKNGNITILSMERAGFLQDDR